MYIFDIDGTLANADHRLHHILDDPKNPDWDTFFSLTHLDAPILPIILITKVLWRCLETVVLLTGRNERCREETEEWMKRFEVPYDQLIMRPLHDHRPDHIVKLELLDKNFTKEELSNIQTIFEDRKCVTEAFRARGYHVCQVAEGDY